ncbi:4Fe-4S cluster-binding domain-containing protein [uncultured Vagococcus sp.]|uniref:4Fe-4S cluster-binding domain-containing protein n=1 Tax=uncultured Vagococcus sp. TaxID=189676 RepID=UPI0028D756B9|nr:4Fe-4S cluster-binding domain-containing protein [uncultured Vagococcus sp.]
MTTPLIFNIQKFSVHDGPGIRTTIFFKGCPIRCAWCHNPESQSFQNEIILTKDGQEEIVGKSYTIDALVKEIEKDRMFYEQSGGGVTLSGGEVMSQNMIYLETLVKTLTGRGISVVIDTCGIAPFKHYERLMPYVDLFLYDLKFIRSLLHTTYTGTSNRLVLENLKKLSLAGASIDLRLIMLEGLNSDDETVQKTLDWLQTQNIQLTSVHLLPYHQFGKEKYSRLKREMPINFSAPSNSRLTTICQQFNRYYPTFINE